MILGLLAATEVEAGILYSTTDLGHGYQLQSGAGGQDYGVTGSNGVTYAFDKSPVTSLNVQTQFPNGTEQHLTMQIGSYQVGYNLGEASGQSPSRGGSCSIRPSSS